MSETTIAVLLVEDNPGHSASFLAMLEDFGQNAFSATHVASVGEAVELVEHVEFNVILLDLRLPDSKGIETLLTVRAVASRTPIVVLSSLDDEATALQAVREGAQDYLVKGRIDGVRLARALRYAVERHRLQREWERLSLLDELTELYNLRGFLALSRKYVALARRQRSGMVLVAADMDGLNEINDAHGHDVGNRALCGVADVLKQTFRKCDVVARIGGDQFAVLMVDVDEVSEDVTYLRERILGNMEAFNLTSKLPIPVTCSLGVVRLDSENAETLEMWLARADAAMYVEKGLRKFMPDA